MKNYIYFTLVIYFLSGFVIVSSQNQKTVNDQIKKINSLFDVAKKDLISSGDILKKIIKLSQEVNYSKGELKGLINLGVHYTKNTMIDSANFVYDKGEKIVKKNPDLKYALPSIYNSKGSLLVDNKLHSQALKYFHKSHKLNIEQGNKRMALITKMNMLDCYLAIGEPDKVIAYADELLEDTMLLSQDELKNKVYSNLGLAYFDKKQYGRAINWWTANLEMIKNSGNIEAISFLTTNIADAYRGMGNYEKALQLAVEAKTILNGKLKFNNSCAKNAIVLGRIYNALGNTKEAILHFENAIMKTPNDPMDLVFSYKNLGAIHERIQSWAGASKYYEKYGILLDSLYIKNDAISVMSENKIQLLKEDYKSKLRIKDRDNNALSYKNDKQKLYINTLIGVFFSLLIILLAFITCLKYRQSEREFKLLKEKEDENEKEKRILQAHLKSREEEFQVTMTSVNERLEKLTCIKKNLSNAIQYNNKEELITIEKRLQNFISSTSDFTLVLDRIESKYPSITAQIIARHPELSPNDIRHCVLMKLNLSIKESAQLLSVSIHAIKMARKRLKKKMNISEDVSLKDHLQKAIS